jgi:hypothetical protein
MSELDENKVNDIFRRIFQSIFSANGGEPITREQFESALRINLNQE